MLICFDLDGTLANIEHRLDYVRNSPKNWPAFDAGIPNDAVNQPVAEVFRALKDAGNDIVFASVDSHLYMRKANDFRSDDIVKQEILKEMISVWGCKPDMVFDDRKRVVDMWRRNGIWVFDCNQSGKDF
jgi:hypothetical protein